MIVEILHVKYLFEEKLGLRFEVSHNLVVLSWCDQLLEFAEDVDAATRVVCIFHIFKVLNLHKEVQELVESLDCVNIDIQECFKRLIALGELVLQIFFEWTTIFIFLIYIKFLLYLKS